MGAAEPLEKNLISIYLRKTQWQTLGLNCVIRSPVQVGLSLCSYRFLELLRVTNIRSFYYDIFHLDSRMNLGVYPIGHLTQV